MSQENVEVVRNFFTKVGRGDVDAWELLPPDFVIDLSRRRLDPTVLRGPDEMRAFYREIDTTS
jgi:ketosteroid isomerase-like protein